MQSLLIKQIKMEKNEKKIVLKNTLSMNYFDYS